MSADIVVDNGGALEIGNGAPVFSNCSFTSNIAKSALLCRHEWMCSDQRTGYGGAVHVNAGSSSFSNGIFNSNTAGACFMNVSAAESESHASQGAGGAVQVDGGTPSFSAGSFSENNGLFASWPCVLGDCL
jgi:hypothetical protein